jgi:hypothetical protein
MVGARPIRSRGARAFAAHYSLLHESATQMRLTHPPESRQVMVGAPSLIRSDIGWGNGRV